MPDEKSIKRRCLHCVGCLLLQRNQWEEVDNVTFDETVYEDQAPLVQQEPLPVQPAPAQPAPMVVRPEPVYIPAPQPVYDCPCAEVQVQPCYQQPCYQPCACQPMPVPQPKVTTTKKLLRQQRQWKSPAANRFANPL